MELQHSSPRPRGRTARGSALLCVVIAVATLEPSVAAAAPSADGVARLHDVERARVELALGQRRYDEGRYEQALPAFEAAYAAYPVAELQFNVALCHERLGHTVAAIDAFEAYLADAIDSTDRADVEARLAVLRAALPAPSAPAVVPSTPAATRAPADLIDPFRLGRRAPPTPRPTGNGRRMTVAGASVLALGVAIGVAGGVGFGVPAARGSGALDPKGALVGELTSIGLGAAMLATGVGLLVVGRRRHRATRALAWVTGTRAGIQVTGRF